MYSLILGTDRQSIRLYFSEFATEYGYDFVFVYDGPATTSPLLATLSGKHEGLQLLSSTEQVSIL